MSIPRQVGNYQLESMLGRGGTSEVWLGRHKHLRDRAVAVKILMSHDAEAVERFQREAQLTSKLRHPGIVQIYDHGHYQPFYCTVMEYLPGGSLRQLLDRQSRVPRDQALAIFAQVADALDYAHTQGVIHRDVSPGNILLDAPAPSAGGELRARLTDFGIAREPSKAMTTVRTIMGTPAFFSPEHLRGATFVTPQSDIFSLGVVLYLMLSGRSPWAQTPGEQGFAFGTPPALTRSGEVDRVLRTMLAIDPEHRYPTARAAVDALEKVFARHGGTTVVARGESASAQATPASLVPVIAGFASSGVALHPVEQVLGPRLRRAPVQQAEDRAERLRQPAALVELLDAWSTRGRLRQRNIGRLAMLRRVSSRNIYFYRLQVLYETRDEPRAVEEPDLKALQLPLESERDHWGTPLPRPQGFEDAGGGEAVVKGSTRVVNCAACQHGVNLCPSCKGQGRVVARRPMPEAPAPAATNLQAAQAAGPAPSSPKTVMREVRESCPACQGRGNIPCQRCQGVGRLIQRRVFGWQRASHLFEHSDELDAVELRALQGCTLEEVYRERVADGFHNDWARVPDLAALIEEAKAGTDANTRVVLSEVSIAFAPATDIEFFLAGDRNADAEDATPRRLTAYGFEDHIPGDWNYLNWDRALLLFGGGFCLLLAAVSLALLLFLTR